MEPNFVDEGHCDVFINESEIRLEERIENERFQKNSSFFNQKMMIQCNIL
jgi:hypothetical protein